VYVYRYSLTFLLLYNVTPGILSPIPITHKKATVCPRLLSPLSSSRPRPLCVCVCGDSPTLSSTAASSYLHLALPTKTLDMTSTYNILETPRRRTSSVR